MLLVDYLDHCEKHYPTTRGNETEQTKIAFRFMTDYLTKYASVDIWITSAQSSAGIDATGDRQAW